MKNRPSEDDLILYNFVKNSWNTGVNTVYYSVQYFQQEVHLHCGNNTRNCIVTKAPRYLNVH